MVAVFVYLDKNECTCNMMFQVQLIKETLLVLFIEIPEYEIMYFI